MSGTNVDLYVKASELARVAMGRERIPRGRRGVEHYWRANDDPLAWWCLTEAIVALVREPPRRHDKDRFEGGQKMMNEDQIKHMVSRFLGWKLPADFSPDAGISFKAEFNENTAHPMRHEPSGTNLLNAVQAEAMVRYMVEGLPK